MRHKKNMVKLGRSAEARKALLSSLVANFIEEQRIKTTVTKAKQTRMLAEKLVTVAKKALAGSGTPGSLLNGKTRALAVLRHRKHVDKLFNVIAPQFKDRVGGYTRIIKLGRRGSDSSEMVLLEWVNLAPVIRGRKPKTDDVAVAQEGDAKKPE
jgi:large subunit ribosomal protein L17